jgi:hypothetical protein
MILYHITDSYLEGKILREGLIGDPVVYLGKSPTACRGVRRSQIENGERLAEDGTTVFRVDSSGLDLFDDPNSTKTMFGEVLAFMVYADLEPHRLAVIYD